MANLKNTGRLKFTIVFLLLCISCYEGGPPSDPCDDVTCNEPYEKKIQTASTVCQCVCAPGFGGPDCTEFEEGNCEYVQCQNGGVRNRDGDYCYCECPPNYGGQLCEIPLE